MERRMSLRVPAGHSAAIKSTFYSSIAGKLRDISFDGAFFIPEHSPRDTLRTGRVRLRLDGVSPTGNGPLKIEAWVVSARNDGVGLLFDGYDETMNN